MDFIILKDLRISISNISHYEPFNTKNRFFNKEADLFGIEITLKNKQTKKINFKTKQERDIFLVQMDTVLLSYFKK